MPGYVPRPIRRESSPGNAVGEVVSSKITRHDPDVSAMNGVPDPTSSCASKSAARAIFAGQLLDAGECVAVQPFRAEQPLDKPLEPGRTLLIRERDLFGHRYAG